MIFPGANIAYMTVMEAPLYNPEILRLAASIPRQQRLAAPHVSILRSSPVCGSRVEVDLCMDAHGRVADFGLEVHACALGQASAAILGQGLAGKTAADLCAAHAALAAWLTSQGPLPAALQQYFPKLAFFEAARAHPGRHPSICLAFAAAAAAAEQAGASARAN